MMSEAKKIIGVIGPVGSGKSTVSGRLGELGCAVICADTIAHELLGDKGIHLQLQASFGADIFLPDGEVDRVRLGEKVFESLKNVETINGIIHPGVLTRCEELIAGYQDRADIRGIVLDMPLLLEAGWEKRCDIIIFVECSEAIRADRMLKKGLLSEEHGKKREKFQISLDKKRKVAHYIVDNNSGLSTLVDQVDRIFSTI